MYEVHGVKVEVVQLMCVVRATSLSWPVQMAVVVPRGGSVSPEMYSFFLDFTPTAQRNLLTAGYFN
jgi:hypothetical protein